MMLFVTRDKHTLHPYIIVLNSRQELRSSCKAAQIDSMKDLKINQILTESN